MSKILIVEDEESIADLEKDYLELSGFEVEIENDGTKGLERALHEEFDLFILDLMLPGVDGFEICKKIRETKNTPILMVSAKKDDIDKIRGLGLGADDYVTKPFYMGELLARIRVALRKSNQIPEEKKEKIYELFLQKGIDLDQVKADENMSDVDDFDFICHVAYNQKPLTRKERAENVKKRNVFGKYGEAAREVLNALLDKYADSSIYEIEDTDVLKLDPFTKFGKPSKIAQLFGGKEGYLEAVRLLKQEIYKAVA